LWAFVSSQDDRMQRWKKETHVMVSITEGTDGTDGAEGAVSPTLHR
jgi:hypothetical protein